MFFEEHLRTAASVHLYYMSVWISGGFSKKCIKYRSSHQSCSIKKGVLKNSAKLNGKHLCQSLFLIKLQASGQQFTDIFPV